MPRLSVVMSVRDGLPWLAEAIDSVLTQTFQDFELVVVDDGSTDCTPAILGSITDPRVRVLTQAATGLTVALARGIAESRGMLVARMDADDVALPERFARQVAFLDGHSEVGLLGTGCHEIGPSGEIVRMIRPPVDDAILRRVLIRRNPFVHASVMLRREALEAAGGYETRVPVAQDYDLWLRMSRITRMANLPEPLVLRRLTPGRVTLARETARLRAEVRIKLRALRRGDYSLWCGVFLVKPLVALALPGGLRRRLRSALSAEARSGALIGVD